MSYPAAVDLRSEYESVYSQGTDPSCGPHAITAALDCIYERATGRQHRFSKDHIWWWSRVWLGMAGQITGSTFDSLEKALRINGAISDGENLSNSGPSHQLVRTELGSDGVGAIKRLLCMGVPVVLLIQITDGFYALKGDWKTHSWTYPEPSQGEHFVCIVGYDDAAGRFLVENSWGSTWGDGGFCGFPYEYLYKSGLVQGWMHIDSSPIIPKPVEGFQVATPNLRMAECADFVGRSKTALMGMLTEKLAESPAALVAECKRWGVSDKHLESLAGWPRGAVRQFSTEHPDIDWAGFVWDQL